MNEDETADQITSVFSQAVQLVRDRGLGPEVNLEMKAMDLLLDFVLVLGAEGVADVLTIIALEHGTVPATRSQVKAIIGFRRPAARRSPLKET
jgi:hypothetical protein